MATPALQTLQPTAITLCEWAGDEASVKKFVAALENKGVTTVQQLLEMTEQEVSDVAIEAEVPPLGIKAKVRFLRRNKRERDHRTVAGNSAPQPSAERHDDALLPPRGRNSGSTFRPPTDRIVDGEESTALSMLKKSKNWAQCAVVIKHQNTYGVRDPSQPQLHDDHIRYAFGTATTGHQLVLVCLRDNDGKALLEDVPIALFIKHEESQSDDETVTADGVSAAFDNSPLWQRFAVKPLSIKMTTRFTTTSCADGGATPTLLALVCEVTLAAQSVVVPVTHHWKPWLFNAGPVHSAEQRMVRVPLGMQADDLCQLLSNPQNPLMRWCAAIVHVESGTELTPDEVLDGAVVSTRVLGCWAQRQQSCESTLDAPNTSHATSDAVMTGRALKPAHPQRATELPRIRTTPRAMASSLANRSS
jgi:hypothetical protein